MQSSFGVIIVCCDKDWPLAMWGVDSIRTHMGEVPICLLMDGRLFRRQLGNLSNVQILCRHQVADQRLRQESFSWGFTKMAAFWESPFERYLLLDADICVMGDLSF